MRKIITTLIIVLVIVAAFTAFFLYRNTTRQSAQKQSPGITTSQQYATSVTNFAGTTGTTTASVPSNNTSNPALPHVVSSSTTLATKPEPVLNGMPTGPHSTLIQDFGSQSVSSGWTAEQHSVITLDTSIFTQGTKSLALTTDGLSNTAISKVLNQGPYNLTNKYLEIWIRVSSATNIKNLWFSASSDNLAANFFTWKLNTQIYNAVDESEIQPGEWIPIVLTFDSDGKNMVTTGNPDITTINSFELQISDRKAGPVTIWLGGIATVPEPAQGAVTIVLDNGWISEYTLAMPTLAHYGFPAVIAEIPQTSDNKNFMSVQQLQYLQNNLGWDIACHTWDHAYQLGLPTVSTSIMDNEFSSCKKWLIDNGLGKAANILVWPNGSNSPAAISEAKKYFVVARGIVGTMFNTLPPANPMLLYSTEFGYMTATSTLYEDVDRCAANHEWCIFYGHIITTGTPINQDQYSSAAFNDFIAHIASVGIPVKTMTEVLKGLPSTGN